MSDRVKLTTIDNPWSPFANPYEWRAYDTEAGYDTPGLLARVVVTSSELSDLDQRLDYERGIEEIVRENVSGMHKRVYLETESQNNSVQ